MALPFVVALPEWVDPVRAMDAIVAAHPHVFWLDAGGDATSGWSIAGHGHPAAPDPALTVGIAPGETPEWTAGPFRGGWVGWYSYDEAARRAGAPADGPDRGAGVRADRWVSFDHAERRAYAVAASEDACRAWAEWIREASARGDDAPVLPPGPPPAVHARHSAAHHADLVERCRDAIRRGDAYQLCLTTRFSVDRAAVAAAGGAFAVYRRLRASSPSHHGGFVRVGGRAIASATPERFLDVGPHDYDTELSAAAGGSEGQEHGRARAMRVRTLPIKGTRPRGTDAAEDAALARELVESEKERAENVMIVDLMRNDLSRISEPGSIRADTLLEVESYPHVHQLVSTVSGRVRPDATLGEMLAATFPAGSMTGAPKLSAMTILHDLENGARGVFAGCWGWVGDDGTLDLAMIIRTIVFDEDGAHVGAGGGITWSSVAEEEVHEVGTKARAPLAALGASLPPGW